MLIDWITVWAQLVNFLVLVWLLHRFLFKPVLKAVEERGQKIRRELENANKQNQEAQKARESLVREQEELANHRNEFFVEAREEAQKEKDSLLQEAQMAYESFRSTLRDRMRNEQETVLLDTREKLEKAIFHIAKKVLTDITHASLEESVADLFIHKLNELSLQERDEILIDIRNFSRSVSIKSAFVPSTNNRLALEKAVQGLFGENVSVFFETHPELVCGFELVTSGHKVSWNISDYISLMRASVCTH